MQRAVVKENRVELGLNGKVVVITGGATGMGLESALRFGEEGCSVAICGRRKEKLDEAMALLESKGINSFAKVVDVTHEDECEAFGDDVIAKFGRLDIWINNAGRPIHKAMMDTDLEEWHDVIDTDLTSIFIGTKAAAKRMPKEGGVVLNAGSFQSIFPAAGSGPYGAAKAGVCSLTRSFAAELASRNIRVLTYIPGVIETPMARVDNWIVATNQQANIPMPRAGTVSDIADTLVFLASERASYINGVSIEITGGKFCVQNPRYSWE